MAVSRFVLKTLPGVDRPAICTAIPTAKGHCHMLDLGANVDSEPKHLLQFALMGQAVVRAVDGLSAPRVALLGLSAAADGEKCACFAAVPPELRARLPADQWLQSALEPAGGRGGGKPDLAQGTLPNGAAAAEVTEAARAFARAVLS